jgi:sec-independent protein translocase protein TatB
MLGLSFEKIMIIAAIAAFVIGPTRLPAYASKLARLAKSARAVLEQAQLAVEDELGPEFSELEWKKLDPRQYDPRHIIREALLGEPRPAQSPSEALPPSNGEVALKTSALPQSSEAPPQSSEALPQSSEAPPQSSEAPPSAGKEVTDSNDAG